MTEPVVNPMAARIADRVEGMSIEQVDTVIAMLRGTEAGDPVGTVRHDPEAGALGHRVLENGVALWRVTNVDGGQYNDLAPTLDWPAIYEPVVDDTD